MNNKEYTDLVSQGNYPNNPLVSLDEPFINNAGSLGPLAVIGHPDTKLDEFQSVFDFNVTSSSYLTAEFIRQLFGENSYYSLIVKEDPMIKKVQTLK